MHGHLSSQGQLPFTETHIGSPYGKSDRKYYPEKPTGTERESPEHDIKDHHKDEADGETDGADVGVLAY